MLKRYEMVEAAPSHKGRRELMNHLSGKRLTPQQAIYAKCYECMGYYADGTADCGIISCPLFPTMPYSIKRQKSTRVMTPENREKAIARFKKMREAKEAAKNENTSSV
jgi:hypothetical protein